MKSLIAYIDDSRQNLDMLSTIFEREFPVSTFQEPEKFLETFGDKSYASILVDLHMPSIDGFSLYEKIVAHPRYNGCPILFISSDVSDSSRVRSFELGAVDFMSREISPEEMVARVKAKILFFQKHRHLIEFDSLRVNLTLLKAYVHGVEIPLTFIELKLLCLVLRHYPDIVTKDDVVEHVWKTGQTVESTVYTHLSNLNSKLRDWDYEIQSVKSKGLRLAQREKVT